MLYIYIYSNFKITNTIYNETALPAKRTSLDSPAAGCCGRLCSFGESAHFHVHHLFRSVRIELVWSRIHTVCRCSICLTCTSEQNIAIARLWHACRMHHGMYPLYIEEMCATRVYTVTRYRFHAAPSIAHQRHFKLRRGVGNPMSIHVPPCTSNGIARYILPL